MKLKTEEIEKIREILEDEFIAEVCIAPDDTSYLSLYLPTDIHFYREDGEIKYSYNGNVLCSVCDKDIIASYERGDYDGCGDWQDTWADEVKSGTDPNDAASDCLGNLIDELTDGFWEREGVQ